MVVLASAGTDFSKAWHHQGCYANAAVHDVLSGYKYTMLWSDRSTQSATPLYNNHKPLPEPTAPTSPLQSILAPYYSQWRPILSSPRASLPPTGRHPNKYPGPKRNKRRSDSNSNCLGCWCPGCNFVLWMNYNNYNPLIGVGHRFGMSESNLKVTSNGYTTFWSRRSRQT